MTLFTIALAVAVAGYVSLQQCRGRGIGFRGLTVATLMGLGLFIEFVHALWHISAGGLNIGVWAATSLCWIIILCGYFALVFHGMRFVDANSRLVTPGRYRQYFDYGPRFLNWLSFARVTVCEDARGTFVRELVFRMDENTSVKGVVTFSYATGDLSERFDIRYASKSLLSFAEGRFDNFLEAATNTLIAAQNETVQAFFKRAVWNAVSVFNSNNKLTQQIRIVRVENIESVTRSSVGACS